MCEATRLALGCLLDNNVLDNDMLDKDVLGKDAIGIGRNPQGSFDRARWGAF